MENIVLNDTQMRQIRKHEIKILDEIDRICRKHHITYVLFYGTMIGAVRHKGYIPWDDDIDIALLREDYERLKKVCKKELKSPFFYQSHDTDEEYYHLVDKIRLDGTIFKEKIDSHRNIHHGVYVDIFPIDYVPDDTFLRKLHFLHFHFYRIGLMSKYLKSKERTGIKKILSYVCKILYLPFSLEYLYNKSRNVAIKCNHKTNHAACLYDSVLLNTVIKPKWIKDTIYVQFENKNYPIPREYDKILKIIYGDYMHLPPKEKRVPIHKLEELKV